MGYYTTLLKVIKSNLPENDRFIISGTYAWDSSGVDLGYTTIHNMVWVLNNVKDEICSFEYGRIKFLKKDFPSDPTKEFWIIDQLNCIMSLDIDSSDAIRKIRYYLRESKINREQLIESSRLYGNIRTQKILSTI